MGISMVASAIGKPLYVDQQTELMKMISYAHVFMQINAKHTTCESIPIELNGKTRLYVSLAVLLDIHVLLPMPTFPLELPPLLI